MTESKVQPIKILYVITQGEMGGAQRYVFDLATHFASSASSLPLVGRATREGGYDLTVAMGSEQTQLGKLLVNTGIKVVYLKFLRRNIHPLHDLLAVFELYKLIRELRPDIIHLNSSKAGVIGSLAARLANHPNVIFTAHGFAFLEPNNFLVRQIYYWAERFVSRFRQRIITVSDYDRQAAIKIKLCPPEKLITIHNGIAPSLIASGTPRGNPIEIASTDTPGNDEFTIGSIAHDYPTKDLTTMRAAFKILKSEFPNLQLSIIGRGNPSGEVQDASKELSKFDIYVCSSIKEGFPYSILEAMRAGLPIVSTRVGGIPEAIENEKQGLLVEPKNPAALAAAIKKLIHNPELAKRLGQAAQKKVQEFSLDKMLKKTVEIYDLLVNL